MGEMTCCKQQSATNEQSSVNGGQASARAVYRLSGLSCADCARHVETAVLAVLGVTQARVNFGTAQLVVQYEPDAIRLEAVAEAVRSLGYDAAREGGPASNDPPSVWRRYGTLWTTVFSGTLLAAGFVVNRTTLAYAVAQTLYLLAILLGGCPILMSALRQLTRHRTLGMDFLMSLAVAGAMALGDWTEAATVIVLFSLAHLLETYSMDRARRSIRSLMDLSPQEAWVKRPIGDGSRSEEQKLPVETVQVGERIVVKPGDKVPMDGMVVSGYSTIDQAPITGESMPVEVGVGASVFAGTINQHGSLEVEVTKPFQESTFARILHSIEEAEAQRAPSQRLIDRFARVYTPVVIFLAIAVASRAVSFHEGRLRLEHARMLYQSLVFLVIACPCALVISTPVAIISGLVAAARNGVLIKGGLHLEEAGRASAVAFDKTGTLTVGKPEVDDVYPLNGTSREHLLAVAASVERWSEHPFAQAIRKRASEERVLLPDSSDFTALPGHGARAMVSTSPDGEHDGVGCRNEFHYVGSPRLFRDMGAIDAQTALTYDSGQVVANGDKLVVTGRSAVLVGTGQKLEGYLVLRDKARENAAATMRNLHEIGIRKTILLTGDNENTAQLIAREVGIDEVAAGLLPEDKVRWIRDMRHKHRGVIMVGDGVNDAPALAAASVGIAMGAIGTDTALETADIALMADDLSKLPFTIRLSRSTTRVIKQNILFAIGVKAIFIPLTFIGYTTLWMAVGADMGASLLVIANAMRLQRMSASSG